MSDTLTRAKELVAQYEASGYIHRDATLLLPELVAECEFWRQRAIEERAQRIISMEPEAKFDRYDLQECPKIGYICDENDGYCVLSECPSITFWKQIAAKELGLQGHEESEQKAYIKRLEKEFLAAKGALIWEEIDREQLKEHYKDVDLPWMSAKERGELIERGAQDALEKIREGT